MVTGCYVETASPEVATSLGANLAFGNRDKDGLVEKLLALHPGPSTPEPANQPPYQGRTRAFLKIQEGCDQVCAFCIVPRTRGRERSLSPEALVEAVRQREAEGVQEVVLTGTQIGSYGFDIGIDGPGALLQALLEHTAVPRIRVSSLQPQHLTPQLLALWEDPRLCRHFHIPLQSGSDAVLQRMRRRYDVEAFRRAVALVRRWLPEAAITTDVIVGFPGESDAEFDATYSLCQEVGFAAIHVFPYSRRNGTLAARMSDQVLESIKKGHLARLLALAQESAAAFRQTLVAKTTAVLWEEARPGASGAQVWQGLTDNYVRVFTTSAADLRNRLLPVRLASLRPDGLWGKLL